MTERFQRPMRVLFDIVHPAHVHFYKHLIRGLERDGHPVMVVSREKDVTTNLLNALEIQHTPIGAASHGGLVRQAAELIHRDILLLAHARSFRPDVVLTRSPSGVHVARLVGATGVFDTDDGRAAGRHFSMAAPFAHVVTTPDCMRENYGLRHVKYPGYKQTAYLHPDHFQPDPTVLGDLGLEPDEPFFLVRFVSMTASHDAGEGGLTISMKDALVAELVRSGRVFISSERPLPPQHANLRLNLSATRLHDALAFATLLVGDSQTMAAEAAVLGTPNFRVSTFAGRLDYLDELEHRYGLTFGYLPADFDRFLSAVRDFIRSAALGRAEWQSRRQRMLTEKENVSEWYRRFVEDRVYGLGRAT